MLDIGNWFSDDSAGHIHSGLFYDRDFAIPVPLKSRTVYAEIFAEHSFTEVTEELAYVSDADCTARFVFPLPPRSAIFRWI